MFQFILVRNNRLRKFGIDHGRSFISVTRAGFLWNCSYKRKFVSYSCPKWQILADFGRSSRFFSWFMSAKLLELMLEIHFSFSRSASIPLVFAVTNMVVSRKKTCFFINSHDVKRYWKHCTGLAICPRSFFVCISKDGQHNQRSDCGSFIGKSGCSYWCFIGTSECSYWYFIGSSERSLRLFSCRRKGIPTERLS